MHLFGFQFVPAIPYCSLAHSFSPCLPLSFIVVRAVLGIRTIEQTSRWRWFCVAQALDYIVTKRTNITEEAEEAIRAEFDDSQRLLPLPQLLTLPITEFVNLPGRMAGVLEHDFEIISVKTLATFPLFVSARLLVKEAERSGVSADNIEYFFFPRGYLKAKNTVGAKGKKAAAQQATSPKSTSRSRSRSVSRSRSRSPETGVQQLQQHHQHRKSNNLSSPVKGDWSFTGQTHRPPSPTHEHGLVTASHFFAPSAAAVKTALFGGKGKGKDVYSEDQEENEEQSAKEEEDVTQRKAKSGRGVKKTVAKVNSNTSSTADASPPSSSATKSAGSKSGKGGKKSAAKPVSILASVQERGEEEEEEVAQTVAKPTAKTKTKAKATAIAGPTAAEAKAKSKSNPSAQTKAKGKAARGKSAANAASAQDEQESLSGEEEEVESARKSGRVTRGKSAPATIKTQSSLSASSVAAKSPPALRSTGRKR